MKAVIFDRDGVVNKLIPWEHGMRSPFNLQEFIDNAWLLRTAKAVQMLKGHGYKVFCATNQPWVKPQGEYPARMSIDDLHEIHDYMIDSLGFDAVYHASDKDSDFYKPKSGMLKEIVRTFDLDETQCWMVGDRWVDIFPGWNCNMSTILIPYLDTYDKWPQEYDWLKPDFVADDILEAAHIIIGHPERY